MITTKTKKITSPVSRYPGSKRLFLKALLADAQPVDAIIEPFAGAAHYSIARLQDGVDFAFLGETDPTVRSLYKVWASTELHADFQHYCDRWTEDFEQDSGSAFQAINTQIESFWGDRALFLGEDAGHCIKAAAGAILRKLTFGGVVRDNAAGEQNAPLVTGQLKQLARYCPNLSGSEVAQKLSVHSGYRQAIAAFKTSGLFSAEALIDPPYYAPREECPRTQTPAYWGHKPHAKETLEICLDTFKLCVLDERIRRVVVTNYISRELDEGLRAIASKHNQSLEFIEGTTLKTMQRSTGKPSDGVKQGFWQIRR